MKTYLEKIENASEQLELPISAEKVQKLLDYVLLMQKWNRVYNLTSIDSINEALILHLFDSMAAYKTLQKWIPENRNYRVYDIGSGAGLPGIVWSILDERLQVNSIDAVAKKITFQLQVKSTLDIKNIQPQHIRVEQLKDENVDIVVSRAFASLKDYISGITGLIQPTTWVTAMKAKLTDSEIFEMQSSHPDYSVTDIVHLAVPSLEGERKMVFIKPLGEITNEKTK